MAHWTPRTAAVVEGKLVMSAEQRSAADAVYVLNAIARLMRSSPYAAENAEWADMHAEYLEDIGRAVQRDAGLDPQMLEDGAAYVGREWEHALIPVFYGHERIEEIVKRL